MGDEVSNGEINGYLARASEATGAGLLLVPHVTGILAQVRESADALAREGITTLAWDPYPGIDVERTARDALPTCEDEPSATSHVRALDYLESEVGIRSVGVLGFCMGGRMALNLAARDGRVRACVPYYPTLRSPRRSHELDAIALAEQIRCPVQVLYGAEDHVTSRETFTRLEAALRGRDRPTIVHVYPQAGHGFMNPDNQGVEANREATRLAWPQSVAFLKASLLG